MTAGIALAIFGVCLAVGLRNLMNTIASLRLLEAQRHAVWPSPLRPPQFVILVPLLEEQEVALRLVDSMAQLRYPPGLLAVHFVTTDRERPCGARPTTREVVEGHLEQRGDPRFSVIHCDTGTDRCKADQLNFAMARLGLAGRPRDDLFIGVYDADSVPDPRVLSFIAHRASDEAKAFQQVALYPLNVSSLPRWPWGGILRARPLHNALFALGTELPGMRRQVSLFRRRPASLVRVLGGWLSHAMGHGQFFRHDLLLELGGFRPPSCDTQFGHALAYSGISLHPVPLLDLGETPSSLRILLEQGVVWFNSMNTFPSTWRFVHHLAPTGYRVPAAVVMTIKLVHSNIAWACYPPLFLWALIHVATTRSLGLVVGGTGALLVYLLPVALIALRFRALVSLVLGDGHALPFNRAMAVLCFPLEKLWACASPWLWCVRRVTAFIAGRSLALRKTERAPASREMQTKTPDARRERHLVASGGLLHGGHASRRVQAASSNSVTTSGSSSASRPA